LLTCFLLPLTAMSQVDFLSIKADMSFDLPQKEIMGTAAYEFKLSEKTDSIFLDAFNMKFGHVLLSGKKVRFSNSGKRLGFKAPSKLGLYSLKVHYTAQPQQTVYFIPSVTSTPLSYPNPSGVRSESAIPFGHPAIRQIWTQGQGKYTSHWLPSFDDMTEKVEFDLRFKVPDGLTVISNGVSTVKSDHNGGLYWDFDMKQPMSSYLVAFVMGNFDHTRLYSKSGVPITLYYEPKDSLKVEPTYRYTKAIFDFLEEEIGVRYPWQNYKQVPVQDFLYAGMENTGCTIFSNQYVIDSTAFVDKNYVNVNAHELAHQWFGNMVTEESGKHHWLHEGFATYYAYLAEKELFGEEHFYWKLYQTANTLYNVSENDGGEALTNPNANSLTFYEKGAWALVMLRDKLGDATFRKGIQNFLTTYAYSNATVTDFLIEMEKVSGVDLEGYQKQWLQDEVFPWAEVKAYLKKNSPSLNTYFSLKDDPAKLPQLITHIQTKEATEALKREVLLNHADSLSTAQLKELLDQENLRVRQAIATGLTKFPPEPKEGLESLLEDASYVTQETTLFKLWETFPNDRSRYLDQMDGVVGLPNKNIRLLWLALALVTPEYQPQSKMDFYHELNGYTDPTYHFEVRSAAFQYLRQIQAFNEETLKNLIAASDHHVWQFKKMARNLLREFEQSEAGKTRLNSLELNEKENRLLQQVLDK